LAVKTVNIKYIGGVMEMTARRRIAHAKSKGFVQSRDERREIPDRPPAPEEVKDTLHSLEQQSESAGRPVKGEALPLAVVLEILAREYEDSVQGEALCRAALRLAEESGAIENYRAGWEAEETNLSGRLSVLLFDRSQSLELIRYHQKKGNLEALQREREKLRLIEGRLLLGGASPARITEEDLEELERYIKECGF
jgi:hypothetical protein